MNLKKVFEETFKGTIKIQERNRKRNCYGGGRKLFKNTHNKIQSNIGSKSENSCQEVSYFPSA